MGILKDFDNFQTQSPFEDMRPQRDGRIADNFGCLLFHLIAKADQVNRARLALSYPKHVLFFTMWMSLPKQPLLDDLPRLAREWGVIEDDDDDPN